MNESVHGPEDCLVKTLNKTMGAVRRLFLAACHTLRAMLLWLGRVPSLVYLLVYLGLVLAFAGIYHGLPDGSFFHATSKYEHDTFGGDASVILAKLGEHIKDNFVRHYDSDMPTISGWVVQVGDLEAASISVREFPETVLITLRAPLSFNDLSFGEVRTSWECTLELNLQERLVVDRLIYFFPVANEPASAISDLIPPVPSLDQMLPIPDSFGQTGAPVFSLPVALYNDIVGFGQGYRGFPSKVSGHFRRMLYLSAGVATASAMGDIVPVTSTARGFVTAEALLALVVIGLFLNALASQILSRKPKVSLKR